MDHVVFGNPHLANPGRRCKRHAVGKPSSECVKRVFCLVNSKSGSNQGRVIINRLKAAGIKCWDLAQVNNSQDVLTSLAKALKECKETPLVMCGGGDGTTVWALSTLDKAQKVHKSDYQFCTIPLGSGNDLSNALGWGNSFESENLLRRCAQAAASKTLTKLDRWNVLMSKDGERVPTQSPEMVNYFNIGYGANISSQFHEARDQFPETYNSTTSNWWKYVELSVKHMFSENRVLNKEVEIFADGKRVKLPAGTKDIVITNINSICQGANYWGTGESNEGELQTFSAPRMGDGKLELMCSTGMTKNIGIAFGGHYHRLAQATTITIKVKKTQAIALDGEAWVEKCSKEKPLLLTFTHKGAVTCPVGPKNPRGISAVRPPKTLSPKPTGEGSECRERRLAELFRERVG